MRQSCQKGNRGYGKQAFYTIERRVTYTVHNAGVRIADLMRAHVWWRAEYA